MNSLESRGTAARHDALHSGFSSWNVLAIDAGWPSMRGQSPMRRSWGSCADRIVGAQPHEGTYLRRQPFPLLFHLQCCLILWSTVAEHTQSRYENGCIACNSVLAPRICHSPKRAVIPRRHHVRPSVWSCR